VVLLLGLLKGTEVTEIVLPSSENYATRITRVSVLPHNEPILSEKTTHIEIEDEAAGEFVKISQQGGHTDVAKWIVTDPSEWPVIRDAIQFMFDQCKE
jgi:hypothetical protein